MFDYPVEITRDTNDTFLVTFPDVPEAVTFGETEDEALLQAVDALETALSFYIDARQPLPCASKPKKGQKIVRPDALEYAKLGVYQRMLEQNVKKTELARRLGWHLPQIERLFNLRHASRFEQVQAAARVLGLDVLVQLRAH